jgi:hypothetical protein
VEISGTESHIFPYQQLITASLVHENGAHVLRLAFSSHDVEITGRNLLELLVALQEFAVKWLRALPDRYKDTIPLTEKGIVFRIRIGTTSISQFDVK